MRLLLVNYRYFVSGGPERYLFNLKRLFEDSGHSVVPFSVAYDANVKSEYEHYFASPLSSKAEVYFRQHSWSPRVIGRTLSRSFYSKEVYQKLNALIADTKPDCAIVLHYLRKLSPAVLEALKDNRIPFVVRLSDLGMICANALLLRDGEPCELCVKGKHYHSVRYKCVQDSLAASAVQYFATKYHQIRGYFDLIPFFVVPSRFALSKMLEAGWPEDKLVQIPTFVDVPVIDEPKKDRQIVYFGRLEPSKGVHILLMALDRVKALRPDLSLDCAIVGNGDSAYVKKLADYIDQHHLSSVSLRGQLHTDELYTLVQSSTFTVSPSLWYDNMPNAVLESLALGTPVVASNHGSFPEIVLHGRTGVLFTPGSVDELANAIVLLLECREQCDQMGQEAVRFIREHHSAQKHMNDLLDLLHRQGATVTAQLPLRG